MPDSVTSAFSDPEDFAAAFRTEGCVGLLITGRGQFQARLTQVTLNVLRLSAADERLARVAFLAIPADMMLIMLPMDGAPLPIYGGKVTRAGEIMTISPGAQLHARSEGHSEGGAIWLPVKELVRYGGALTGAAFAIPSAVQHRRPPARLGRHLRGLHAAAIRIAATRPQVLVEAQAARGLEQQLIDALVECLAGGAEDPATSSERRHQDIMVRFENLLHSQPNRDLRLNEMSEALGISQRLLRVICAAHLGMGPMAYDRLRRMWLVRRTLLHEDGGGPSISEVARHYGFRSPGRFAVNYRAAFGEAPTMTLRRARNGSMVRP
jgi:AraC-like DNA-binding protein